MFNTAYKTRNFPYGKDQIILLSFDDIFWEKGNFLLFIWNKELLKQNIYLTIYKIIITKI